MKPATAVSTIACTARTGHGTASASEIARTAAIASELAIFVRRLMAPCARQSAISGPKVRWLISQACQRSDEREKANAASRMKGVVGRSGTTTPIAPSPREMIPSANQAARLGVILRPRTSCPAFADLVRHINRQACHPEITALRAGCGMRLRTGPGQEQGGERASSRARRAARSATRFRRRG